MPRGEITSVACPPLIARWISAQAFLVTGHSVLLSEAQQRGLFQGAAPLSAIRGVGAALCLSRTGSDVPEAPAKQVYVSLSRGAGKKVNNPWI